MTTEIKSADPQAVGSYPQMANGSFTADGNAVSLTLGFMPRHIKVINETDATAYEWMFGMTTGNTLKTVTAGTTTVDTGSLITSPLDAGLAEPGSSAILSATLCANGKKITWMAVG